MLRARLGFAAALLLAGTGCGAHFHRPFDAATAEQAAGELKGARLTEGFAPELAQAAEMLAQELELAKAWAQKGRDRDLLDVLSATASDEHDPDSEIHLHPRCRGRLAGDGWTVLCHKLTARIVELGGLTLPLEWPPPPVETKARGRKEPPPRPAGPDRLAVHAGKLRQRLIEWRGPGSDEVRLARAGTDLHVGARVRGKSPGPTPRCPARPPALAGDDAALAGEAGRLADLCATRRANLLELQAGVCEGQAGCTGGAIGVQVARALAIHDALAEYDRELARRFAGYVEARRPCAADARVAGGLTGPSGHVLSASPAGCDPQRVARAFAALDEVPPPRALKQAGFEVLAREGRALQLAAQLAALDELIEDREGRATRAAPAGAADPAEDPSRLAQALHGTIAGIREVQAVTDALELSVMVLIRETLRVERSALTAAIGHAERRRRIELARLTASLEEYTLLVEAYARLQRLEAAGCAGRPIVEAQAGEPCRDDLTRVLLAHSNAWMLGRAGQQQADVLELAVHHEASIDRSRAAMAVREVYLAAGVAELVKFNRSGLRPEVLAQLIVNAVGFAVVAGGVY
jgi:hypothetical protein